jgi:hypothetical protein
MPDATSLVLAACLIVASLCLIVAGAVLLREALVSAARGRRRNPSRREHAADMALQQPTARREPDRSLQMALLMAMSAVGCVILAVAIFLSSGVVSVIGLALVAVAIVLAISRRKPSS